MNNYPFTVSERFMRYVQIDTQSDPTATRFPSTEKQKNLSVLLANELRTMGLTEVETDEWGYVYATIPATTTKTDVPVICFCSHIDTAPDCSGTGVKPILHHNYDGTAIQLPDDPNQVLSPKNHPYLNELIGCDIITASGTTLLGADDKAGVAIIMDLANYLIQHPEVAHGKIRILFTPDEEVGRGVEQVNMSKLGAQYGYTLDGGERGSLEGETFSADGVTITINGISAHPGYAKNKMINAIKLAAEFLASLPKNTWSPETTSEREGFVHPMSIDGQLEKATIRFIIRDFDTAVLKSHEQRLKQLLDDVIAKYPGSSATFEVKEQYRNMHEVLVKVPFVLDFASQAMERAGVKPRPMLIRGGTDGSRLSFMGLPCPNLFTGEMAIHSKLEYVAVQDMEYAVKTLVHLAQIWEEQGSGK